MDFLGLRNLDDRQGGRVIGGIDDDDPARRQEDVRHARARRGAGVFQFESSDARGAPAGEADLFEDLIALVALYRPGPCSTSRTTRSEGRPGAGHHIDPRLKAITGTTYGSPSTRSSRWRSEADRGFSRPKPTTFARRSAEDPRPDGVPEGQVHHRLHREQHLRGSRASSGTTSRSTFSFNKRTPPATR